MLVGFLVGWGILVEKRFLTPFWHSELDADYYDTISESLENWFDLIIRTGGWGGRGTQSGSL